MQTYLYFTFAVQAIVIIVGIYYWRYLSLPLRLILVQVAAAIIVEAIGTYLVSIKYPNNIFVYNTYNLIELWLLGYVGKLLIESKRTHRIIILSLVILTISWGYSFVLYGFNNFYNWFFVLYCILLVIIYIVVLFTSTFKKEDILRQPLFLLCLAFILYYACTVPLFGIINYLIKNDIAAAARLFYISHIVNVLRYALIAVAFYLYARQAKTAYVQQ